MAKEVVVFGYLMQACTETSDLPSVFVSVSVAAIIIVIKVPDAKIYSLLEINFAVSDIEAYGDIFPRPTKLASCCRQQW